MDRDTVRLLLLALGVIVLSAIYLWGRYGQRLIRLLKQNLRHSYHRPEPQDQQNLDELEPFDYSSSPHIRREPDLKGFDYSLSEQDELSDEADLVLDNSPTETLFETHQEGPEAPPFLIQISVVAGPGRFFDGLELKQSLLDSDLLFGEMGIFHRFDREYKQSLFSVASLVEPGTFPIEEMEDFECPGIVLFFQTARVSNPLQVYDDLVETSRELASRLHGVQWDESRQPLTAGKISHMRNLLKHANSDQV